MKKDTILKTMAAVILSAVMSVNLFGQTSDSTQAPETGNERLARILSETNTIPLGIYPPGLLDWFAELGDNLIPIPENTGPQRPVRAEPVGQLVATVGSTGRGGMTMNNPSPNDPAPEYDYQVVDLGTLGSISYAYSINANGQIVGSSYVGSDYHAFVYDRGAMSDLGTLGGNNSSAAAINASGQIAGISFMSGGGWHAFKYASGTMTDLGILGGSSGSSEGHGINTSGQIVGSAGSDTFGSHAFLYSGGSMQDLGTFTNNSGTFTAIAYAIDDFGDVGGSCTTNGHTHAFLYESGVMKDIGALGGTESTVYGINMYAEVVGFATTSGGATHAFFYDTSMQDLGVLSGASASYAFGMNNSAHVVGTSGNHAFLVSNGSMKDLNDSVVNTGWTLQVAYAINDKEQIVGYGLNPSGQTHAFLLRPLPAGALQASANVTPIQTSFGTLPVKDSTKNNLIVIAHGWQINVENLGFPQPDVSWVDGMSNNIVAFLTAHSTTGWQVYGYKWINNAWVWNPSDALNNAKKEGQRLGNSIVAQGWTHVHFIGHSAGAGLIQAATDAIKNPTTGSPSIVVHETFLDPFVGSDFGGVYTYGRGANWADQYFARDKQTQIDPFVNLFTIAPYTESPLFDSYNVDVTPLDSHKTSYTKFASSANGAQIAETCTDTETTHHWPIDFYTNTIVGNVTSDYQGFGFPLSEEGGNWSAISGYGIGNGTSRAPTVPTKVLGTPDSDCTIVGTLSPPSFVDTKPDTTQLPTIESTTGTIQKYINHLNLLSGSPAWLSTVITSTNPVNFIAFDAEFTSAAGAQGVLTVLWDTNIIGAVDERVVAPDLQHYQFSFPNAAANSPHVLGLRLDPFTNIQSVITLTNIVLNQAGVSQPFSLSITTNVVSGLRVLRLDGEAGFNYNVQAIADLTSTNWTQIAILANTNGTVFFYDQDQNSYSQRFYRAVAQ